MTFEENISNFKTHLVNKVPKEKSNLKRESRHFKTAKLPKLRVPQSITLKLSELRVTQSSHVRNWIA